MRFLSERPRSAGMLPDARPLLLRMEGWTDRSLAAGPPTQHGRFSYGTVGTWPASSCASRAALSLFPWAAFSLGTTLPLGPLLGAGREPPPGPVAPVAACPLAAL